MAYLSALLVLIILILTIIRKIFQIFRDYKLNKLAIKISDNIGQINAKLGRIIKPKKEEKKKS